MYVNKKGKATKGHIDERAQDAKIKQEWARCLTKKSFRLQFPESDRERKFIVSLELSFK